MATPMPSPLRGRRLPSNRTSASRATSIHREDRVGSAIAAHGTQTAAAKRMRSAASNENDRTATLFDVCRAVSTRRLFAPPNRIRVQVHVHRTVGIEDGSRRNGSRERPAIADRRTGSGGVPYDGRCAAKAAYRGWHRRPFVHQRSSKRSKKRLRNDRSKRKADVSPATRASPHGRRLR